VDHITDAGYRAGIQTKVEGREDEWFISNFEKI
jgi:hypothetical protein